MTRSPYRTPPPPTAPAPRTWLQRLACAVGLHPHDAHTSTPVYHSYDHECTACGRSWTVDD